MDKRQSFGPEPMRACSSTVGLEMEQIENDAKLVKKKLMVLIISASFYTW